MIKPKPHHVLVELRWGIQGSQQHTRSGFACQAIQLLLVGLEGHGFVRVVGEGLGFLSTLFQLPDELFQGLLRNGHSIDLGLDGVWKAYGLPWPELGGQEALGTHGGELLHTDTIAAPGHTVEQFDRVERRAKVHRGCGGRFQGRCGLGSTRQQGVEPGTEEDTYRIPAAPMACIREPATGI